MSKQYFRKILENVLSFFLFLGVWWYVYYIFQYNPTVDVTTYIKSLSSQLRAYDFLLTGSPGYYFFSKLFDENDLFEFIFVYSIFLWISLLGFIVFFENKFLFLFSLVFTLCFIYIPFFDNPIKYFTSVVRQTIAVAFFFLSLKFKRISYVFYFLSFTFHFSIFIVFFFVYKFKFSILLNRKTIVFYLLCFILFYFLGDVVHDRISHYRDSEFKNTIFKDFFIVISIVLLIFLKKLGGQFRNLKYYCFYGTCIFFGGFLLPSVTDRLFVFFYFLIPVFFIYFILSSLFKVTRV